MLSVREVNVNDLKPWEDNPRDNDSAVDAVARSISSFGFNVPILCDTEFAIVAGHTRWKAARKLGLKQVPVIVLSLSDTQKRAFAVADNKTAEIATWNLPRLRGVLEELRREELDLGDIGFSEEEIRKILGDEGVDENHVPTPSEEPLTQIGDIWQLGEHRLLCGDSRKAEEVRIVVGDREVDCVLAGPPYFNQRSYSQWDTYEGHLDDMQTIASNCHNQMRDGAVLVWNIGNGSAEGKDHSSHHSVTIEKAGFRYIDTIAWVKSGANFSIPRNCHIKRNGLYYPAFQWEALLVYQKPGDMPHMSQQSIEYMSEHQTNVWEIPAVANQVKTFGHPAVCPVEVPYRCLQAYTAAGNTVLEPFGGSGTTLIAAEKAGRQACVIEKSPHYCDVIVRRWENLTGGRAVRIPV
jgi:site-specific DNA-methyltransferase (adenine-specific)